MTPEERRAIMRRQAEIETRRRSRQGQAETEALRAVVKELESEPPFPPRRLGVRHLRDMIRPRRSPIQG